MVVGAGLAGSHPFRRRPGRYDPLRDVDYL